MGIPRCVDESSERILTILQLNPQHDNYTLLRRGMCCYIKPDAPLNYTDEEKLLADGLMRMSENLHKYVLISMPEDRYRRRLDQQARIGLSAVVKDLLVDEERVAIETLDYNAEPIFIETEEKDVVPVSILSAEKLLRILRSVNNYIRGGQSVSLNGFTQEQEEQIIAEIRKNPDYASRVFMSLDLFRLNEAVVSSEDPDALVNALIEQIKSQQGDDVVLSNYIEIRQYLNYLKPIIILDGVRSCIQKKSILQNNVSGLLRSIAQFIGYFIARGDVSKIKMSEDIVSSPLFNIFANVSIR